MTTAALRRTVSLPGAVLLGLGSMLGTGVFVSLGLATGIVGESIGIAIIIASIVATCNGISSARLAAAHPVSGGTYAYGYRYLHPTLGFSAGWLFLCAKGASAATAALGFSGYLLHLLNADPSGRVVPIAIGVTALMTIITLTGLRRTNVINAAIVAVTVLALLLFIIVQAPKAHAASQSWFVLDAAAPQSLLHATALVFVAFTGYGRIATLGEEVRNPARTIPIAVVVTLFVVTALYVSVGVIASSSVGPSVFALLALENEAPLAAIVRTDASHAGWIPTAISIGALTAMLGVLLNLILGLSRVVLAMGREGDLPTQTALVSRTARTPWVAIVVVGAMIVGLVAIGSVSLTWTFSATTVLAYYAVTNLCALRLPKPGNPLPTFVAWCGLASCIILAFAVPAPTWMVASGVLVFGLGFRFFVRGVQHSSSEAARDQAPPSSS